MKREFTSLTAQEALHVAIFIEERNAELYQQFAELFAEFKDPESLEIAQVFWDMVKDPQRVTTKNGKPALRGSCLVCGTTVYTILGSDKK